MPTSFVAVDIGNTRVHFARFDDFQPDQMTPPIDTFSLATSDRDFHQLAEWLNEKPLPWYAVSVQRAAMKRLNAFASEASWIISLSVIEYPNLPIEVAVPLPQKVGTDRLAAAVAANQMRDRHRPAIIVDAGTAITIDAVSAEGKFLGGAILPGMRTAAQALASQTDALPQVDVGGSHPPQPIGTNTQDAIASGLFWGTVGAVQETVCRVAKQLGESLQPHIYFSGGDVNRLAPWIDLEIERVDHLVLRGVAFAAAKSAKES